MESMVFLVLVQEACAIVRGKQPRQRWETSLPRSREPWKQEPGEIHWTGEPRVAGGLCHNTAHVLTPPPLCRHPCAIVALHSWGLDASHAPSPQIDTPPPPRMLLSQTPFSAMFLGYLVGQFVFLLNCFSIDLFPPICLLPALPQACFALGDALRRRAWLGRGQGDSIAAPSLLAGGLAGPH